MQWLRMQGLSGLHWESITCQDNLCYLYISLSSTAQVVTAKYHRLGGLNNRYLFIYQF